MLKIGMEEANQALTDLGLMPIQAKLLLALQRFNQASVKDIAEALDIHPQQVYPALEELHKLGLVEKIIERPTHYKTIPLDQTLIILLERKTSLIAELYKKTPDIVKNVNAQLKSNGLSKKETYDFTLITGFEMMFKASHDWVKNAQ